MTEIEKLQNKIKQLERENLMLKNKFKETNSLKSDLQNEEVSAINEELIATNEALKESEEYLNRILDESVDAIIHLDSNGKIFYANKSAKTITGYSLPELLEMNIHDLFDKTSIEEEPLRYDLISKGEIIIKERYILRKDKRKLPVEMRSKKLPHGEIQTSFRDITERKEKKELNLFFKKIFTQSPDGIFQIDKQGLIVRCNKAFADSVGLSIEKVIGRSAADFIQDKDFFKSSFKKLKTEGYIEAELKQLKADKSTMFVWRKAIAFYDEQEEFNGAFVFNRDMTEKIKQAELQMKLSTAVEQSANVVIITDVDGNIEYVNNKFEEFTGYKREEVIGKNPRILKSGKQSKQFYKKLWKTIKSGKQWSGEFQNKNKKGDIYWESATISPVFNKDGEIINFIAVKENITEKKEIAQDLKKKNKEYEQLNQKHKKLNEKLLKLNIELEEQTEKYRDIFNAPKDCVFIHDVKTGVVVDVNRSIMQMFGYKPKEVVGYTVERLSAGFPPYDEKNAIEKIQDALIKGENTFEWISKHKNGSLFWSEVNLKFGKIGGVERIIATVKNISERKKQEEKLKESEERFKAIFDHSPDIIILTRAKDFQTVNVNKTFAKITGFQVSEVVDKSSEQIGIWVDYKQRDKLEKLIREQEVVYNFKTELKKKSGEIFHVLISIRTIILKGEKHYVKIVRDITETVKIQEALFESEQKFKELADLSPSGIFIYQNNTFVYVNKATCEITGYSEDELLKMKFWEVVHEDMKAIVKERGRKRVQGKNVTSRYELKLRTKDGTIKWIDFSAAPITYKGKPSGIGNVFDITENKRNQEILIEAKKKAEESDRLKSAFLANMSHEIRTPMNGIVGFSELLAVGNLPERQKQKYIQIIRQSSDQLLHIINDILDISKIEVGEVKVSKASFNIDLLLKELNSLFTAQIKQNLQKNIKLSHKNNLPANKMVIYSDKFRLHQIMSNLINNALKFTEEGFVTFGADFIKAGNNHEKYICNVTEYDKVLFFVKDSGPGISEEMKTVIFDRFRQSDDSTTRKYSGTGLGLSIAKGLVQILGGEIWLKSKLGKGSVFYFTLPYEKNK